MKKRVLPVLLLFPLRRSGHNSRDIIEALLPSIVVWSCALFHQCAQMVDCGAFAHAAGNEFSGEIADRVMKLPTLKDVFD